ncbi:hypothetical protein N0V90_012748 [Kalmusia sp. IMI 367209]|nr:hypothetical protein N0V90_012748 [Kalmusia sp. IMI 367209]
MSEAKHEVTEELLLASEQEAASFRRLLTAEVDESRAFRVTQVAEIQENQAFRSRQALAQQRSDARLIEKSTAEEAQKETAVIYYFFDSLNKKSLEIPAFLRCIVHQTVNLETLSPDVQRHLESLFGYMDQLEPSTSELEQLFLDSCGKFKRAFLLIDGLDEVDKVEQRNIKSFLKEVQNMDGARILAFTHTGMDMSEVLIPCSQLHITAEDLKDDIETFIESQIGKYSQGELSTCSPSVLDIIKRKLTADAEGITGDQAERAKRTFQWVIYSERPLTINELEEAVSITPDQKSWQSPSFKFNIPRLARLCGNLIEFDEANKTVWLAHHTVEDFLQNYSNGGEVAKFALEEARTEQYLADVCLTYLSFTDFHQAITRTSDTTYLHSMNRPVRIVGAISPSLVRTFTTPLNGLRSQRDRRANQPVDLVNILRTQLSAYQAKKVDPIFQLLDYCKCYWHSHSRYLDPKDAARFTALENFVRGTHLPREWMPWSSIEDKSSLPLWNMSLWTVRNGHTVMFCIWQKLAMIQESSYWEYLWQKEGQRLFTSACETANFEQLEMILDARERIEPVGKPSESEIGHAFMRAFERLLQEKADVNAAAAVHGGRTALQAAAGGGYLTVVERLLQENADVNAAAAEHGGRTALQAAAEGGHLAVVEQLLQGNADVNAAAAEYSGKTALQAAAAGGHLAVVERLLQEKADVNAVAYRGTALQAAAGGGHLAVVEQLLQEKADIHAQHVDRAVHAAAGGGHLAVVEWLLQEKADVNALYFGTALHEALHAAAGGGHLAVVKRLLQEKVNVNARTGLSRNTALQAAAEGGHLAVVERLLEEKADVNAATQCGETALQLAMKGGHLTVAQRLQRAGTIK